MSWLPLPWGRMRVEDPGGPGRPVVLLHGTGCDVEDWDAVVGFLPPSVRSIRMDFRGHGRSDVPRAAFTIEDLAGDVLALLESSGLEQVTLAGHSLGGMVAMSAARRSPRIGGLVLLEGWTSLRAAGAFYGDRHYGRLPRDRIASIQDKYDRAHARFQGDVWESFWDAAKTFDAGPWLRTCRIPVVEVYGDLGKTPDTERMLDVPSRTNIRLVWLPGAGHYLPHEAPVAVARITAAAAALR